METTNQLYCPYCNQKDSIVKCSPQDTNSNNCKNPTHICIRCGFELSDSDIKTCAIVKKDDYCPNCNAKGYVTNGHSIAILGGVPDCTICCKTICIKCSTANKYSVGEFTCNECKPNSSSKKKKTGNEYQDDWDYWD